jgi:hypothetical protein
MQIRQTDKIADVLADAQYIICARGRSTLSENTRFIAQKAQICHMAYHR